MVFVKVRREFASFVSTDGPGEKCRTVPLLDLPQQLRKLHRLFRIGERILTAGEPVVRLVQPPSTNNLRPRGVFRKRSTASYHNFVNFVSPGTEVTYARVVGPGTHTSMGYTFQGTIYGGGRKR